MEPSSRNPPNKTPGSEPPSREDPEPPIRFSTRVRNLLIGPPRDLGDVSLQHRITLVAFLAWVGLGADGLSSSTYGPEEAFRTLGPHTYLAIGLTALMACTILIISAAYSRIIELFPHGGGGYVVATKLLGTRAGVVSGCALVVDYVLTISISIAASGDAIFSLLPFGWQGAKLPFEFALILLLIVLNLRGVRESVITLAPVFLLFLLTHAVLILVGFFAKVGDLPGTMASAGAGLDRGLSTLGAMGLFLLFAHAYSLGGGTYTGIEAVSNGLAIMREPRVQTGKRTMLYMGVSLAFTASGLLFCYLLWKIPSDITGKTMNAVFAERFVEVVPLGKVFVILTLVSEGALLVVAAQAGFVDGPRVLANMAVDSWFPRRFSFLSDRLTVQNGILLMGSAALGALYYTRGAVHHLVVMYSINVFLTFSLSMAGMFRHFSATKGINPGGRARNLALFGVGFLLCATILGITLFEKFATGGWVTIAITGSAIGLCFMIKRHYRGVERALQRLDEALMRIPVPTEAVVPEFDPRELVAVLFVTGFNGKGVHSFLAIPNLFKHIFRQVVFVSVGVVDFGQFKGGAEIQNLRRNIEEDLKRYVALAHSFGWPAEYRMGVAAEPVPEIENISVSLSAEYPQPVFFAGQVIFPNETFLTRFLHNDLAFTIQRRLQFRGLQMVILPVRAILQAGT